MVIKGLCYVWSEEGANAVIEYGNEAGAEKGFPFSRKVGIATFAAKSNTYIFRIGVFFFTG